MNKFLGLLIYFSFGIVFAQNPHRIFESVEIIENQSLEIKVNDGLYKIVPYTKNIVQTTRYFRLFFSRYFSKYSGVPNSYISSTIPIPIFFPSLIAQL